MYIGTQGKFSADHDDAALGFDLADLAIDVYE